MTIVKVYAPQDRQIQVHQSHVSPCPSQFPSGFFWYGNQRASPGRPPRWVDQLLQDPVSTQDDEVRSREVEESNNDLSGDDTVASDVEEGPLDWIDLNGPYMEDDGALLPDTQEPVSDGPLRQGPENQDGAASWPAGRYELQQRVTRPDRPMALSSGRAHSEGGVTDLYSTRYCFVCSCTS